MEGDRLLSISRVTQPYYVILPDQLLMIEFDSIRKCATLMINLLKIFSTQFPKSISSSLHSTQARLSICLLSASILKWIEESAY
jgi:hypothetical protein